MPSITEPKQNDGACKNLSRLPLEINHRIFSYLSQRECLECMRVCQLWRRCTAEWSVNHWKSIQLRDNDLDQLNPLLYIINPYVRQIAVLQPSQKSIIKVIDRLVSLGFNHIETFSKSNFMCNVVQQYL